MPRKSHSAQQVMVPPKRARCGTDGALAAHWLLRGANDPEGWLGCAGAPGLVLSTRITPDLHKERGEPSPVQWHRTPPCPGEPQLRRSQCSCALRLFQGWVCTARHRAAPQLTHLFLGFTKMFYWRVSLSHSCCRGLPPCQVQAPSASSVPDVGCMSS